VKLVDHILKYSAHKFFSWIVFVLTVFESIFLFIPPEVFMTPPIVADKRRALPIIIAASLGSIVGGAIAYMIGLWLFDSVGMWLINHVSSPEQFAHAQALFAKYGTMIIVLAAVTPVPYKVMAICAGFLGFPAWIFIGLSAVFRTARFAIVGYLLYRFQGAANRIVQKYFWPLTIAAIAAAALGIFLLWLI
jgi:membrane protein YqaA with SNARE-associated domain